MIQAEGTGPGPRTNPSAAAWGPVPAFMRRLGKLARKSLSHLFWFLQFIKLFSFWHFTLRITQGFQQGSCLLFIDKLAGAQRSLSLHSLRGAYS